MSANKMASSASCIFCKIVKGKPQLRTDFTSPLSILSDIRVSCQHMATANIP